MFGTLYLQQADHPLFVCPNGNWLKFKQWSVALYRGNTNKGTFRGLHFAPKYRFKCKCLLNKSSNEMLIDKSPLGPAPASRFFEVPSCLRSVFTWRHGGHIGVRKQWNGGHVVLPRKSCGSWALFLCKRFLLFQYICIDAAHVSGNTLKRYFAR